jgi:methyl-accepting chemotaxis protein
MFVEPSMRESAAYRQFWASLNRGEYLAAEYKRIGRGGKEVWIQASYNPILDLNGKLFKVVKYATDTTTQVLARMGNERVRAVMETGAGGAERFGARNFGGDDQIKGNRDIRGRGGRGGRFPGAASQ